MRISHRYKFVFISKPRCASTTVRNVLDPYSDIISGQKHPYHHHYTLSHYTDDQNGRFLVDSVLVYERIDRELPELARKLGFEIGKLPRLCSTAPVRNVAAYYGADERKEVEHLFAHDLALGDYELF